MRDGASSHSDADLTCMFVGNLGIQAMCIVSIYLLRNDLRGYVFKVFMITIVLANGTLRESWRLFKLAMIVE